MTIGFYHLIYGYRIEKIDYIKMLGYSIEDVQESVKEESKHLTSDEILEQWFEKYKCEHTYYFNEYRFVTGDTEFLVRNYTHDQDFDRVFVIGLDIGKIDATTLEMELEKYSTQKISILKNDERYKELIGDEDPKLYILTDDCDCCS